MWYLEYITGNGEKVATPLSVKEEREFKNLAEVEARNLFLRIKEKDKNANPLNFFWRVKEVYELKI